MFRTYEDAIVNVHCITLPRSPRYPTLLAREPPLLAASGLVPARFVRSYLQAFVSVRK